MNRARGLYASVIGRRLVVLFVIAAFVPIAAMVSISVTRVSAAAEAALEEELAHNAKTYGMQLLDQLARMQYLLEDAVSADALRTEPRAHQLDRLSAFDGIVVVGRSGAIERQLGKVPTDVKTNQFRPELEQGKTVLTRPDSAPAKLIMRRQVAGADGATRTVIAAIKMEQFWGYADTFPAMTDFCVATATGVLLNCSRPIGSAPLDWTDLARGGARTLIWNQNSETLRARAWTLFVGSRFVDHDWVILAIQPEAYALQAANSFRAGFVQVTLLALLTVLLVSSSQIRRILVPLQQLLRGTVKVANNDFNARIEVTRPDEFGQLATAFNDMSERLGVQFRTFAAFADIDRTILTTLDLEQVAATAGRCIRDLAGVEVVSIALVEPGSDDRLRVYNLWAPDREHGEPLEFVTDFTPIAASPSLQWSGTPPLPDGYLDYLRQCGARTFALLPFTRGAFASGVVVLGHAEPQP